MVRALDCPEVRPARAAVIRRPGWDWGIWFKEVSSHSWHTGRRCRRVASVPPCGPLRPLEHSQGMADGLLRETREPEVQRPNRRSHSRHPTTPAPCHPRDSQESSPTTQFKSVNSSVLSFLYGQLSHSDMTTGKTIALTRWTFVGKIMSLPF